MTIQEGGAGNGTTAPYAGGTHQFSFGQEVTLTATPYDSSIFDFWGITTNIAYKTGSSSSTNPATFIINGTGTITANYKLKTFNVTVTNANTGWGTVSASGTVEYGKNFAISATPVTNYDFNKWAITSGSSFATLQSADTSAINALVSVKGAVTVQASFKPKNYMVNISVSGPGTVNKTSQNVAYSDSINIIASPSTGANFTGWTISDVAFANGTTSSSQNAWFKVTGASPSVQANFVWQQFTVTTSVNDGNYGSVSPVSQTVSYGGYCIVNYDTTFGCKYGSGTTSDGYTITREGANSIRISNVLKAGAVQVNFNEIDPDQNVVCVGASASLPTAQQDGSTWYKAYTTLARAMQGKPAGTVYWVAKGTYTPIDEISGTTSTRFEVLAGDTIYGGFEGNEILRTTKRDTTWMKNPTILSGNIGGGASSTRIALMQDRSHVNGVIFSNGRTGVTMSGRYSSIKNCILKENTNKAIVAGVNVITIENCIFTSNTATGASAILVNGDTTLIQNCVFYGNVATTSAASCISVSGNSLVFVTLSTFYNNKSETPGQPAVLVVSARTRIIGSVFYNNVAGNGTEYNEQINTSVVLTDTTIIEDCYIQDSDGHAILGTHKKTGTTFVAESFNHAFNNTSLPTGADGLFFTVDDGFNIGGSSVLCGKTSLKGLVEALPMSSRDILGKSRTPFAYDIGAYQH